MPKKTKWNISLARDGTTLFSFPVEIPERATILEAVWCTVDAVYSRLEKMYPQPESRYEAINTNPFTVICFCEKHGQNAPCPKCFPRYAVTPKTAKSKRGKK